MLNTENEIKAWLEQYEVENYIIKKIHGQYVIDVEDHVSLDHKKLKEIPIQFGTIMGNFNCSYNNLISLKGAPKEVHGHFSCAYNELTSLNNTYIIVKGHYDCSHNELKNLIGAPVIVDYNFNCINNNLVSLEGAPQIVGLNFVISKNPLTSLKYLPNHIKGSLIIQNVALNKTTLDELMNVKVDVNFHHIARNEWEMIPCLKSFYQHYLTPDKYVSITQELLEKLSLETQINNINQSNKKLKV